MDFTFHRLRIFIVTPLIVFIYFFFNGCSPNHDQSESGRNLQSNSIIHEIIHKAHQSLPSKMDSSLAYMKEAQKRMSAMNDTLKAFYFNTMGVWFWYKSEPDSAIAMFRKVLRLKDDKALLPFKAQAANNTGTLFGMTGRPDSAIRYLETAFEIDTKRKNERGISKSLYDLAMQYKRKGQYILALKYLDQLPDDPEVLADSTLHALIFILRGNIYSEIDSSDLASTYFEKGFKKAMIRKESSEIILATNSLLAAYCSKPGKLGMSRYYAKQGLSFARKSRDSTNLLILFTNLGQAYQINGISDSAQDCFEKAGSYVPYTSNPYMISGFYNYYADALFDAGKINPSRNYYRKALELAVQIGSVKNQEWALFGLSRTDSTAGNFSDALTFYKKGVKLKDSLLNINTQTKIAEIQILHQTKEKEFIINELREKDRLNRFLHIAWLVMLAALIAIFVFVLLYYKKRRLVAEQRVLIKLGEHEMMQTLLESHKQELTGKALSLARDEKMISHLKNEIQQIIPATDEQTGNRLRTMIRTLQSEHSGDKLWKEFEKRFDDLNDGFIARLLVQYPDLSPAESRLCAMLKLQLSSKEIAEFTGRSVRTIEFTRLKIRQKMNLDSGANLIQHLMKI